MRSEEGSSNERNNYHRREIIDGFKYNDNGEYIYILFIWQYGASYEISKLKGLSKSCELSVCKY